MVEVYKYIDKLSMLCVARWLVLTREKYAKDLVSRGYTEDNARYWAERKVLPRKVSGNSYAHSWSEPSVSGTAVNKKFGADLSTFTKKLQNDVANQWHPIGCDTVRSVVDHELAHQLDDLLSLHIDTEVVQAY